MTRFQSGSCGSPSLAAGIVALPTGATKLHIFSRPT